MTMVEYKEMNRRIAEQEAEQAQIEMRDKFALAALAEGPDAMSPADAAQVAATAYSIADAMLLERERRL